MRLSPVVVSFVAGLAMSGCGPDEPPVVSRDQAAARSVGFQGQSFTAPPRSVQDVIDRIETALRSSPPPNAADADDDDGEEEAGAAPAVGTSNWREIADSQPPAGLTDGQLARFLFRRSQACQRIGRTAQMLDDTRRAAALARAARIPGAGSMYQTLALREWNLGRSDAAFAAIEDGLALSPNVGVALALHRERIAFLTTLGRRAEATRALAAMSAIAEPAIRTASPYADLYRVRFEAARGALANSGGRYREGEQAWRTAAAAALRMRDRAVAGTLPNAQPNFAGIYTHEHTRALGALAHSLMMLGRINEAEAVERGGLDMAIRSFGPWSSQATIHLVSLGQIVMAQGRIDEGERLLREVWKILDRNQIGATAQLRLRTDVEVANALALKGQYRDARAIYDRMSNAMRELPVQADRFLGRNPLYGLTLLETGSPTPAITALSMAFDTRASVFGPTSALASVARALRAEAYLRTGNAADAAADFSAALGSLRRPIGAGGDDEVSSRERMRRIALDHAIDHFGPRGGTESTSALAAADTFGSLGVQAAIQALAVRSGDVDPATRDLLREEQDTGFQIGVLERQLVDSLSRRGGDAASTRAIQSELAALRQARQRLRGEIVRRSPQLQRLERNAGLDVARLAAALRDREVALAIHTGPRQTHVWAVTRAGVVGYHRAPIGAAAMAEQVARLRRALDVDDTIGTLRDIRPYDVPAAQRLYATLIEPVRASWGDATTLVASVSGPLASLPLGVLVTRPTPVPAPVAGGAFFAEYRGVPFLAREVAIAHVPSLSAFLALRELRDGAASRRSFLAFADPVFSARPVAPSAEGPVVRRAAFRSSARASATLADLPPLPDTAEEARAIATVLGAAPDRDLYLGARATERSVRSLDMQNWRVVMFATHGLLAGDLDGLTEPALALAASGENADDGLLTVGKIMTLRLDADWVVLSACNTAGPQGAGGEALSGVSRAFLYAGARSLLVTHWPVETTAARNFTVELFKRQAAGDATRGAAMRAVSEEMIARLGSTDAGGRMLFSYAHPLFWAPFAFVGDPG
ncbi:MAG: CHAT domain-containing protein [Alphaproteobacteria bacterium]|nr:CHAT domain-containing protein [Alphaproteobacteria bacterium]